MCPCLGLIYQVNEYSRTSFVRDTDREYVDVLTQMLRLMCLYEKGKPKVSFMRDSSQMQRRCLDTAQEI